MEHIIALVQIAATIGLVVAPTILIVRLIAGPEPLDHAMFLRATLEPEWPRGVQEEDAPVWHTERLRRPTRPAAGDPAVDGPRGRSVPTQRRCTAARAKT